jgi:hypothetical protein
MPSHHDQHQEAVKRMERGERNRERGKEIGK